MTKLSRIALAFGGVLTLPLLAGLPAHAQPAPPQTPPQAAQQPERPQLSPTDRSAMVDAHIAAIHAGLRLTPDQEKLWPAVESAARDGMKKIADLRERTRAAARPADPIEGMSRMAEAALVRGEALKKISDAAKPLYASLTDEQKRRLPLLMHGGRGGWREGRGMGDMMRNMMGDRGPGGPGMMQRGDGTGPRMGMGPGTGPGDDRRGPPGERRRGAERDGPQPSR